MLACWINRQQEQAIAYLREENRLLKAKLKGHRLNLTDTERRRLAVLAHPIDRKRLKAVATIATADTLQHWYQRLVAQQGDNTAHCSQPGQPRVATEIEQLVVRMAEENVSWGYRRIQGAMANLGYHIDKITVRNILRRHHLGPAPTRRQTGMSWSQFLKLHWEILAAAGFFTVDRGTLAEVRTSAMQLGNNLTTLCVQRAGLLYHGFLGVMIPWIQLYYLLSSRYRFRTRLGLVDRDRPCAGVLDQSRGRHTGQSCVFLLVLSRPTSSQCMVSRGQQERDSPAARWPGLTGVTHHVRRGKSTSRSRLTFVSRRESHSSRVRSQNRHGSSVTDAAQAAA